MRINRTYPITAGTPLNVFTGLATALDNPTQPVYASNFRAQMAHGGTGLGYLMGGIMPGRIPAITNTGDVTAELPPATATAPGEPYTENDPSLVGGIDVTRCWVDGGHTGDNMIVSWDQKN